MKTIMFAQDTPNTSRVREFLDIQRVFRARLYFSEQLSQCCSFSSTPVCAPFLHLEQEMTPTRTAEQEGFSVFRHVVGVPGSGTRRRRRTKSDGGDDECLLPPPLLPESMSLARFAGDGSAGGLQGLSPGPGQGPYAAKFRSPCSHSQQSAMMTVDQSAGSIFDATSPLRNRGEGDRSILSPGAVSIKTASSLCLGEEGEEAGSKTVDAWDEGDGEKKEEERAGEEQEEEKGWGENDEDEEVEDEEDGRPDDEEESDEGRKQHQEFDLLDEERERAGAAGGGAAAVDHAQACSSKQTTGSATRYKGRGGGRNIQSLVGHA